MPPGNAQQQPETGRQGAEEADHVLVPAIQRMRGCLHYRAGIDPISNTMINVSVWASLEDAKQMETLAPMLALAEEFASIGVTFERPIANYETVWSTSAVSLRPPI